MREKVVRVKCPIFRVQQGDKTFRVSQPDGIVGHDTERCISLSVVSGEDMELSVSYIILNECSVHQQPQQVVLIELKEVDPFVLGERNVEKRFFCLVILIQSGKRSYP